MDIQGEKITKNNFNSPSLALKNRKKLFLNGAGNFFLSFQKLFGQYKE